MKRDDDDQLDLFPVPAHYGLVDRMAEEIQAECTAMARAAIEEINRRHAFYRRSAAQRRRFERYRKLIATYGAKK
jgi:hypothetical protein